MHLIAELFFYAVLIGCGATVLYQVSANWDRIVHALRHRS